MSTMKTIDFASAEKSLKQIDTVKDIKKKHKPDTLFYHSFFPYLLLLWGASSDGVFLYNLFSIMSYEHPALLVFEIGAMLVAFDVGPIWGGILAKRIKQGLSQAKIILYIIIAVFILGICLNTYLRISTIPLFRGESAVTEFETGSTVPELNENAEQSSDEAGDKSYDSAVQLCMTGIVAPVLTSIISFVVSYLTYDPLGIQIKRTEIAIEKENKTAGKLRASKAALEAEVNSDREELDNTIYNIALDEQVAKALEYCNHVNQRIIQHLGTAQAASALAVLDINKIAVRINDLADAVRFKKDHSETLSTYPSADTTNT